MQTLQPGSSAMLLAIGTALAFVSSGSAGAAAPPNIEMIGLKGDPTTPLLQRLPAVVVIASMSAAFFGVAMMAVGFLLRSREQRPYWCGSVT